MAKSNTRNVPAPKVAKGAPMIEVIVDWSTDCGIQDALRLIHDHEGKIVDFNPDGPEDGMPWTLLGFKTKGGALDFLRDLAPQEDDEDLLWLIDNTHKIVAGLASGKVRVASEHNDRPAALGPPGRARRTGADPDRAR